MSKWKRSRRKAVVQLGWFKPQKHWDRWDYTAVIAAIGGVVAALLLYFELPFFSCMFRWLTGWPCISCGLTRATLSLVRGQVVEALHYNPLGLLVELCFIGAALWGALSRLRGWKRPLLYFSPKERQWLWRLGVVLVLLNYAHIIAYHRPWEEGASGAYTFFRSLL